MNVHLLTAIVIIHEITNLLKTKQYEHSVRQFTEHKGPALDLYGVH
jgi:hypothetical protein